ncbi:MAG TPA: MerR family transcriptional regulator [Candidatus Binataceae bacterium]|nr:MerR family transcriptional regulator [Candidatus Binataceae bacterium]
MAFPAAGEAGRTYKISEAARLIGVKAYVLRFWETQFPALRPSHTQSKHRVYRQKDLDLLKQIKQLLHAERFTIEGAKKRLKELNLDEAQAQAVGGAETEIEKPTAVKRGDDKLDIQNSGKVRQTLVEIRNGLESLHKLLQD